MTEDQIEQSVSQRGEVEMIYMVEDCDGNALTDDEGYPHRIPDGDAEKIAPQWGNLESAGCVVTNNEGIVGYGATADAAWADFLQVMADASTTVLADGADSETLEVQGAAWCRARDYTIRPATAALIAQVDERGGNIAYEIVRGIACTVSEYEAG